MHSYTKTSSGLDGEPDVILMMTSGIVSAYLGTPRPLPEGGVPGLISATYEALASLNNTHRGHGYDLDSEDAKPGAPHQKTEKATPAQIRKSITHDALISFGDGKPYKTLRRHLTLRGLTPEAYRAKHGLPVDYPMTSAGYSAQRSELARSLGLGRRDNTPAPEQAAA